MVEGMPSARAPMPLVPRARRSRAADAKMMLAPADVAGVGDAAGALLLAAVP